MGDDFGKLILRLMLGILVLLHGIAKLKTGVGGMAPLLSAHGLPAWVAYGAYLGEVLGPVLLILGIAARTGAFLVFANMVFAVSLVHLGDLATFNKQGGWQLELQAMFLFTAFALMFMSPGRYAIWKRF